MGVRLRAAAHRIAAMPHAVWRSPLGAYRAIIRGRDWLLAKIEYLQTESAKWRTAFTIVKMPFSVLRALGLNPQMAAAVLIGGTAVGGGAVVNATILSEKSFSAGHPGQYSAPNDIPVIIVDGDNTLRVDLGTTPVGTIVIENVTIGTVLAGSTLPSGESSPIIIGGNATSTGFNETFLEVGHMTLEKSRCTKLFLTNIEAYELNIAYNASDGHSISAVAGTPRNRAIGGGNRADSMETSGGSYDQIKLTAATSGINGRVDRLILRNLYTEGGTCVLDRIKAGTLDVFLNEVGAGDGFSTKDFVVSTSTVYKIFNNTQNVEVSISPP